MIWTGRDDDEPCCGPIPGAVTADEFVARLLYSGNDVPDAAAFQRKELHPPEVVSNVCGDADGLSVARRANRSDAELCQLADTQAALRPDRVGRGARVARVGDLRDIRWIASPDDRIVFVYDDPKPDDPHHAVVRVSDRVPRTDFDRLRTDIFEAFAARIHP